MLPGQATSFLSSPGLFAPSFSLAIRKTPGLLAVIPSFYTSQHKAASAEKPALMIQDSDPYDRIISEEQYGHTQTDTQKSSGAPEQRSAVKCWSGMKTPGEMWLLKPQMGMRRLDTKHCTTELHYSNTRPLGNYRANIKGCWTFAFPNLLMFFM